VAAQRQAGQASWPGGGRRRQSGDSDDPAPGLLESTEGPQGGGAAEPDVVLDVPRLAVEEIALEVDNLHARIALEARLADLVQLQVGADVRIERVALEIKGVEAQAHLEARLDRVLAIIERALDTVDKNPQLLAELSRSALDAASTLGEGVGEASGAAGELVQGVTGAGEQAGQVVEGTAGDLPDTATSAEAAGDESKRSKPSGRRRSGNGNADARSKRQKTGT
jgi:hypothetical protein